MEKKEEDGTEPKLCFGEVLFFVLGNWFLCGQMAVLAYCVWGVFWLWGVGVCVCGIRL